MARSRIEEPSINLTPLIDVVFVILIMFILIAPLLKTDQIELANASNGSMKEEAKEASPIAIHVQKDNSIQVNGRIVAIQHLQRELKVLKAKFPKARPQLFHDRSAYFGTYQNVKNALEEAGFEQLDLILKPS